MLSLYEILKASKTGIATDMWTALAGKNWGGADSGHEVKELTGIPPLSFTADGTPLLDYLISGNMSQTGTPSPTTPIQPSECGDLIKIKISKPLCGISTYKDELNLATGACTRRINKLVLDGTEKWVSKGNPATFRYENSPIPYTLARSVCYCSHFKNLPWQQVIITNNSFAVEFTSNPDTINIRCDDYSTVEDFKAFLAAQYANGTPVTIWYVLATPTTETITVPLGLSGTVEGYLNQSGTPTPTNPIYPTANGVKQQDGTYSVYESYQIPISSANTTTPVYLGEVQTTRKIKKLVLTGEENSWRMTGTLRFALPFISGTAPNRNIACICSYYIGTAKSSYGELSNGECTVSTMNEAVNELGIYDTSYTTLSDFKAYLQQQCANGTPVCVWYVLATPTTGIVNEPLRKIGDYADTVSMEQAGVSVPTNRGNTVIDVETELKPSEMYIKYQK